MCPCFTSELFSCLLLHLQITHPAGCMSQFIKFFGEQILVLWKFALLRKRILIFSPPPVGVVCYRGMFPGTLQSSDLVGWSIAEMPASTEGTDVMQVFKIHCDDSSWRYRSVCIYTFPTKCFSSGLVSKDTSGTVKLSSCQHRMKRALTEFVDSRMWDSYGRTDYFLCKTECHHLRSSGGQGHFRALTIVFIEACGRTGQVGFRMPLRKTKSISGCTSLVRSVLLLLPCKCFSAWSWRNCPRVQTILLCECGRHRNAGDRSIIRGL